MATPQAEPSMEDILASIRQIISDDEDSSAEQKASAPSPEESPSSDAAEASNTENDDQDVDDVLTLTPVQIIEEDASSSDASEDRDAEEAGDASPAIEADTAQSDVEYAQQELQAAVSENLNTIKKSIASAIEAPSVTRETSAMLAEQSAEAASKAFQNLNESLKPEPLDSRTLEDVVTELMTPMLKAWLDEHLPTIVEEKVEEEVQRLARRAR